MGHIPPDDSRYTVEDLAKLRTKDDCINELLGALEALERAMRRDLGAGYAGVALAQAILAKHRTPAAHAGEEG
jgi:ribosomal protein L10